MARYNPFLEMGVEFDVEYGNAVGFYSGSKSHALPYPSTITEMNSPLHLFGWKGRLAGTNISLKEQWLGVGEEVLTRRVCFIAVEKSVLFDMVSRYVVYSEFANMAFISGMRFLHQSKNLYYQFENVKSVEIPLAKKMNLVIAPGESKIPAGFREVFYIRDEKRTERGFKWVVHHRLMADPSTSHIVLRCCHPRFEGKVPLESKLPRKLKMLFFRIREARFPNFPFMSVSEGVLEENDYAAIETRIRVRRL